MHFRFVLCFTCAFIEIGSEPNAQAQVKSRDRLRVGSDCGSASAGWRCFFTIYPANYSLNVSLRIEEAVVGVCAFVRRFRNSSVFFVFFFFRLFGFIFLFFIIFRPFALVGLGCFFFFFGVKCLGDGPFSHHLWN